jgi:hypothetical protein
MPVRRPRRNGRLSAWCCTAHGARLSASAHARARVPTVALRDATATFGLSTMADCVACAGRGRVDELRHYSDGDSIAVGVPCQSCYGTGFDERTRRMRSIGRACRSLGLTKADRINIAVVLFDRNLDSFNQLSIAEIRQATFAFNGAVLAAHTLMDRKKGHVNGSH